MRRTIAINPKIALRNIESSMRAEGFSMSAQTKAACGGVVSGRKNAAELVDAHVRNYARREQ